MLMRGTPLGFSSSTPAAFLFLFALLLTLHLALGLIKRAWAFSRGELLTITLMLFVAAALPTRGVTGMLLPMITGTYYYATSENQWATLLHPHQVDWTLMGSPEAVKGFYEGGWSHIPWDDWLPPLMGWGLFYIAFYMTVISIVALLRCQWVDNERLPFPMAQVSLALVGHGEKPGLLPALFKKPIMWCGFALPFTFNSLNALHHYFPNIPLFNLTSNHSLFPGVGLRFGVNFLMVGFAYFINTSIAFSLWFFYLIKLVQDRALTLLGIDTAQAQLGPWSTPIVGNQQIGALIVLVFSGLWFSRHHLKAAWRRALGMEPSANDAAEIMSYRSAFIGLLAGSAGMSLWLWQAGLPAWVAPIFVAVALIIFVGLTRIVAETGLPIISPALVPAGFVVSAIGVPALGTAGMITTGYSLIWAGELLVFFMAPLANGLRLSSHTSGNPRRLLGGIWIAIGVTLALSVWFTLHLAYKHGGTNLDGQFFGTFPTYPSSFAARKLAHPTGPDLAGWLWTLSGGGAMALLIFLRQRFLAWPLHPLGFAASGGWTMAITWSSVFIAWAIKVLILRYGGAKLYQTSKPFFIGLILGQFVAGGFWLVIDSLTGTVGNRVPMLY